MKEEYILYTNAQSLLAHKEELQHQIINIINPAFVALSETRLTPDIDDCEVNMPGYSVVRCDGENRNAGGVMMYIRDDIKYEVIAREKIVSNCWCVAVEIKDLIYRGIVLVVYHSPSASDGDFVRFIVDVVDLLVAKGQCIMLGDFNIDLMADMFYARKIINEMLNLGMKQYVDKPTRITESSQTLIDLVFANTKVKCIVYDKPRITDHLWVSVELNKSNIKEKYREFTSRDYSKFLIDDFLYKVEEKLERKGNLEVNERVEKFIQNMVAALDMVAPKKKFKIPKVWEGKKWYTDDIRMATKTRDEAYAKAIYTGEEQDWLHFKTKRNIVVKIIRKKKKEYYEYMIDGNKNDPVLMWKTLKEVIRGEAIGSKEIDKIDFELVRNVDESNVANNFNLFYIQSINNIIESIENNDNNNKEIIFMVKNRVIMENFELVNLEKLEQIVMALPNKKGTDEGISSDILKMTFHVIKYELLGIINDSLTKGVCPEGWKTATVIPIPKIEKPRKASDYRPINILPIYEKVLELIVKEQIEEFVQRNDIISEHQSGYRKYHSCESALQSVLDDWKLSTSEGKMIGVVFLDLKRAFETVDRKRLLVKLDQYGMKGKVLEWFRTYLNNRFQQVKFNNKWSKCLKTEYGVPQGSVLGPLLFTIYINDIVEVCPEEYNIKMFADDTLLYVNGECSEEIERKANTILNIVEKWMCANKLKMNVSKTKFMIVRSVRKEQRGNIKLRCYDGNVIERVDKIKHLGVIIDDRLQFKDHCDYMLKKIGKKTSFLNRIGNFISAYARCTVYKSIIAPHFEYCASLLVGVGETQLKKLQVAQNRAMRVVLQCNKYTKVEHMLQALQFMSVRQRLYYSVCIFIFKIVNNMAPVVLSNKIEIEVRECDRQTRQAENIRLTLRKTRSAQKSLFYEGIKMYNSLPIEIRQREKLTSFRRLLKEYVVKSV